MNKIYTGNYKNFSNTDYNLISISGDRGAKENYQGQYIRELAPKRVFWDVWFNNISSLSISSTYLGCSIGFILPFTIIPSGISISMSVYNLIYSANGCLWQNSSLFS